MGKTPNEHPWHSPRLGGAGSIALACRYGDAFFAAKRGVKVFLGSDGACGDGCGVGRPVRTAKPRSSERGVVTYVVIGGIAAVLCGVPRATFDLDLLIQATPENAAKLLDALYEAEISSAALVSPEEILSNDITVFKDRIRIDVQTHTPGLHFDTAWERKTTMTYQGQRFYTRFG